MRQTLICATFSSVEFGGGHKQELRRSCSTSKAKISILSNGLCCFQYFQDLNLSRVFRTVRNFPTSNSISEYELDLKIPARLKIVFVEIVLDTGVAPLKQAPPPVQWCSFMSHLVPYFVEIGPVSICHGGMSISRVSVNFREGTRCRFYAVNQVDFS